MRRVRYRVRKFLNKPGHHSVAFVLAEVGRGIVFKIGDCERIINLEFQGYGKEAQENSVAKARLLAQTFSDFADKLEEHFAQGGSGDDY